MHIKYLNQAVYVSCSSWLCVQRHCQTANFKKCRHKRSTFVTCRNKYVGSEANICFSFLVTSLCSHGEQGTPREISCSWSCPCSCLAECLSRDLPSQGMWGYVEVLFAQIVSSNCNARGFPTKPTPRCFPPLLNRAPTKRARSSHRMPCDVTTLVYSLVAWVVWGRSTKLWRTGSWRLVVQWCPGNQRRMGTSGWWNSSTHVSSSRLAG